MKESTNFGKVVNQIDFGLEKIGDWLMKGEEWYDDHENWIKLGLRFLTRLIFYPVILSFSVMIIQVLSHNISKAQLFELLNHLSSFWSNPTTVSCALAIVFAKFYLEWLREIQKNGERSTVKFKLFTFVIAFIAQSVINLYWGWKVYFNLLILAVVYGIGGVQVGYWSYTSFQHYLTHEWMGSIIYPLAVIIECYFIIRVFVALLSQDWLNLFLD